ncbi:hypothetical protein MRX96_026892 [Rhipicephalus microplus]
MSLAGQLFIGRRRPTDTDFGAIAARCGGHLAHCPALSVAAGARVEVRYPIPGRAHLSHPAGAATAQRAVLLAGPRLEAAPVWVVLVGATKSPRQWRCQKAALGASRAFGRCGRRLGTRKAAPTSSYPFRRAGCGKQRVLPRLLLPTTVCVPAAEFCVTGGPAEVVYAAALFPPPMASESSIQQ